MSNEAMKLVLQRVMARLCDLLDEDHFAEIEGIVTNAGVTPPAQQEPVYFCDYGYEGWGKVDAAMAAANIADGMTVEAYYTSQQPAQQEPVTIGEPVGWHSKQYGFVYMALQPHQFEVGSTLCLKNGTPAWRIESSCSMTALISMSSLPHGTVFYTSPPAQPQQEPVAKDWSVFNTGAEVWSGLSLEDAVAELTPERMERGWSAVCVINSENPPLYTSPPPQRKPWVGLTDEDIQEVRENCGITHHAIKTIETKLREKNA